MRVLLSIVFVLALLAPAPARAEDPAFIDWSSSALPRPGSYAPSSEDDCRSGRPACVDRVIREMTRRFDRLAADCDHNAVFSLTYLRTTEEYRRATNTPGYFSDPAFVNHEDAVFARFYFEPFDAWAAGQRSEVPLAWRIALDAARDRKVTAGGNVLLGLNAHINRDLPYVLAGIGLRAPDGSSRKADHDRVNEFLNRVADTLYPELARRFDPTVDDRDVPTTNDDLLIFQAIPAMREMAWRNAERLVNARPGLERAVVERSIENQAADEALAIRAATAYQPGSGGSAARDAYCAEHHDD